MSSVFTELAALWDFDGTVCDTELVNLPAKMRVLRAAFASKGFQDFVPEEEWEFYRGKTLKDSALLAVRRMGLIDLLSFTDLEYSQMVSMEDMEVLKDREKLAELRSPGVVEVMKAVVRAGGQNFIVSNSPAARILAVLDVLGLEEFITAERITSAYDFIPVRAKPDPEVYLSVLNRFPAVMVFAVEDSGTGVAAAVKANVPVVGYVGSTAVERRAAHSKNLLELGVIRVVTHFSELGDLTSLLRCLEQNT